MPRLATLSSTFILVPTILNPSSAPDLPHQYFDQVYAYGTSYRRGGCMTKCVLCIIVGNFEPYIGSQLLSAVFTQSSWTCLKEEKIEEMMAKLDDNHWVTCHWTFCTTLLVSLFVSQNWRLLVQTISLLQKDKMTSISTDKSAIMTSIPAFVKCVTYISHGGLVFASVGFFLIVECAEKFCRLLVLSGKNKITKQDQLINSTVNIVIMQKLNV